MSETKKIIAYTQKVIINTMEDNFYNSYNVNDFFTTRHNKLKLISGDI